MPTRLYYVKASRLPHTSLRFPKVPHLPHKYPEPLKVPHLHAKCRTSMEVPRVLCLPRKWSLKRRKCHTESRGAQPVLVRRQASADIYGGPESTAPATQMEPDVLEVSPLPRRKPRRPISPRTSMEVSKVPRLSRKWSLRC